MIDPMQEETAISPDPLRVTMTDVIKLEDVAAARNLSPITKGINFCKTVHDLNYFSKHF